MKQFVVAMAFIPSECEPMPVIEFVDAETAKEAADKAWEIYKAPVGESFWEEADKRQSDVWLVKQQLQGNEEPTWMAWVSVQEVR